MTAHASRSDQNYSLLLGPRFLRLQEDVSIKLIARKIRRDSFFSPKQRVIRMWRSKSTNCPSYNEETNFGPRKINIVHKISIYISFYFGKCEQHTFGKCEQSVVIKSGLQYTHFLKKIPTLKSNVLPIYFISLN